MDRFLHAERFRKGKVQVKPATVNLKTVVNDVVAQFAYQAKDKDLELHCEVPGDLQIVSDPQLIGMILQNFVSNAIKYSRKGEVQRHLRSWPTTTGWPTGFRSSTRAPASTPALLRKCSSPSPAARHTANRAPGWACRSRVRRRNCWGRSCRWNRKRARDATFHLDLPPSGRGVMSLQSSCSLRAQFVHCIARVVADVRIGARAGGDPPDLFGIDVADPLAELVFRLLLPLPDASASASVLQAMQVSPGAAANQLLLLAFVQLQ